MCPAGNHLIGTGIIITVTHSNDWESWSNLLFSFLHTLLHLFSCSFSPQHLVLDTINVNFVDPCITVKFIKKNPTRCNNVSKFYYSIFIWSSTCFGRHTAHRQEPKTALAASGFSYVEGCWTCSWWTLSGTVCAWQRPPITRPTTFHLWKTRGCQCSFRLLMMGGVSPEICWASYKYGILKYWYIVASCWIFLY